MNLSKYKLIFLLIIISLLFSGCKEQKEINEFNAELSGFAGNCAENYEFIKKTYRKGWEMDTFKLYNSEYNMENMLNRKQDKYRDYKVIYKHTCKGKNNLDEIVKLKSSFFADITYTKQNKFVLQEIGIEKIIIYTFGKQVLSWLQYFIFVILGTFVWFIILQEVVNFLIRYLDIFVIYIIEIIVITIMGFKSYQAFMSAGGAVLGILMCIILFGIVNRILLNKNK